MPEVIRYSERDPYDYDPHVKAIYWDIENIGKCVAEISDKTCFTIINWSCHFYDDEPHWIILYEGHGELMSVIVKADQYILIGGSLWTKYACDFKDKYK